METSDRTELFDKLSIAQFKTQSDYLADKIKHMIINEEFEDGFAFPNENEFCKRLNVSRGTLRDAYKKLATQGFIERTKQGTFVKCKDTIAKQGNFSASLELATTQEMVEFICAFEPEAVRIAAQKIDSTGLCKMEELMEECERCSDDIKLLNTANYRFHEFIRMQAKNNLIISALSAYYDIFNKDVIDTIYFLLKGGAESFKDQALSQHRDLVRAFRAGDSALAKEIAYLHLQSDLQTLAKLNP